MMVLTTAITGCACLAMLHMRAAALRRWLESTVPGADRTFWLGAAVTGGPP